MRLPGREDHRTAQRAGRRSRLSYANVTSTLALFLALSGGAYAAVDSYIFFTPAGKGEACGFMHKGVVELKSFKLNPRPHCPTGTSVVTFNQIGPQGLQGVQGNPGPMGNSGSTGNPGAPGTARAWAVINSDGTIQSGNGMLKVSSSTGGVYCIAPTAASGIDPTTVEPVLAANYIGTSNSDNSAEWDSNNGACGAPWTIVTEHAGSQSPGAFSIVIP